MEQSELQLWRWTGILLLAGGLIFWAGAFSPPYKQWTTRDLNEYLTIIHDHKMNWYFIAGTFLTGVLITVFGMKLLSIALQNSGQLVLPQIGFTALAFGSIFWLLNIAFRVTVTIWAADHLIESGKLYPFFKTWMDWTNLIFAIYMVLAYFGIGCMGLALKSAELLPIWVSWTCMIFGFGGSIFFVTGFPFFAPPLMIHTPLIITGIMILLKIS